MEQPKRPSALAQFATWSQRVVTSPFAPVIALVAIGTALYALPPLGVPAERVADVHLLIGVATLLLVFLLEHNEHRDTTAMHVKLDEVLDALRADRRKVGIEDLSAKRLEDIRETEREQIRSR